MTTSSGECSVTPNHVASSATSTAPVWRKVLYERQPFEDNYVDPEKFMLGLRENVNLKTYEYSKVVLDTFVVVQQLTFVVFFLFAFTVMYSEEGNAYALTWINAALFALSFVFYVKLQHQQAMEQGETPTPLLQHVVGLGRQVLPLVAVIILFSPILQTLTATYSNDTIVALSTFAMCLHVLLTDYNYLNCNTEKCQQNTSVSAATFGTILVASRIQSFFRSGALITFGILCFTLSPIPRHHLKRTSSTAHVGLTFALCGLAAGCLMQVPILAVVYCLLVVAVSLVIPWCFLTLHGSMKKQINGPWDEAKPTNSAAAAEWANAGLLH
ncbi:phosphatidylinositol N-acetylglucosaminyltransferase subunit C [Trypanosoma rangeli]|uniref:Phosphatidylinositol N-acetylglucosaminyltransferase subunit C n=1 Tax=Trypanosoma rangeli TaxID=5698 RepID=A0A3R7MPS8_TRYRA|nr:phosphatidylinositol N-acetylglucosaminyltransferase subunit C [Trypanosoma rangeli]RNF06292.1 phosphatidylinositol N-acetylglucosaminyltransferase subunit C [Trypanosoma rangeli]|eukprot:RNF06292.1 phosphatidylinositol N-acetylglucosaminyltransferase subunit C [Trypanosoma rangeli]